MSDLMMHLIVPKRKYVVGLSYDEFKSFINRELPSLDKVTVEAIIIMLRGSDPPITIPGNMIQYVESVIYFEEGTKIDKTPSIDGFSSFRFNRFISDIHFNACEIVNCISGMPNSSVTQEKLSKILTRLRL
jgi:hypothetical protein